MQRAYQRVDAAAEKIVGRFSLESTVSAAGWQADVHQDSDRRQSFAVSEVFQGVE
jgi:hypothetical protein